MQANTTMMKVLCPIEGKNGKTFWMRLGTAFRNRDDSINIYLDAYPQNGKLQLRGLDERDLARGNGDAAITPAPPELSAANGSSQGHDELPF